MTLTDDTAKIWKSNTGECLPTLGGLDGRNGFSAALSPDGTLVVTQSQDHTAKIWNSTGECLPTHAGGGRDVRAAEFLSDGALVVTALTDSTAKIWTPMTGASPMVLLCHDDREVMPDGAVSARMSLTVWPQPGAHFHVLVRPSSFFNICFP